MLFSGLSIQCQLSLYKPKRQDVLARCRIQQLIEEVPLQAYERYDLRG